jgi:hypothetical protein
MLRDSAWRNGRATPYRYADGAGGRDDRSILREARPHFGDHLVPERIANAFVQRSIAKYRVLPRAVRPVVPVSASIPRAFLAGALRPSTTALRAFAQDHKAARASLRLTKGEVVYKRPRAFRHRSRDRALAEAQPGGAGAD